MPVRNIDQLVAEIFERRAIKPTRPSILQSAPKRAGGRKFPTYLPKPPPPKLVAVKKNAKSTSKPQRNARPKKPWTKRESDQDWYEDGKMEWYPQLARSEMECGEDHEEMAEPWEPMGGGEEEWEEKPGEKIYQDEE